MPIVRCVRRFAETAYNGRLVILFFRSTLVPRFIPVFLSPALLSCSRSKAVPRRGYRCTAITYIAVKVSPLHFFVLSFFLQDGLRRQDMHPTSALRSVPATDAEGKHFGGGDDEDIVFVSFLFLFRSPLVFISVSSRKRNESPSEQRHLERSRIPARYRSKSLRLFPFIRRIREHLAPRNFTIQNNAPRQRLSKS